MIMGNILTNNIEKRNDMYKYIWQTPEEIDIEVAGKIRKLRKRMKISRQRLSEISGVSYGSIKRFEETGNISFLSLTKIAIALDAAEDIKNMFSDIPYKSIQEVINEQN